MSYSDYYIPRSFTTGYATSGHVTTHSSSPSPPSSPPRSTSSFDFPEIPGTYLYSSDRILYSKFIFHSFAYAFGDQSIPKNNAEIFPTSEHKDRLEQLKEFIDAIIFTNSIPELLSTNILLLVLRQIYEFCQGIPILKILFRYTLPFFLCDAVRYIKPIEDRSGVMELNFGIIHFRSVEVSVFESLYSALEKYLIRNPEDEIDIEILKHVLLSPTKIHCEAEKWAIKTPDIMTAGHFWAKIVFLIEHSLDSPVLPGIFKAILEVISKTTYKQDSSLRRQERHDLLNMATALGATDDIAIIPKESLLRFYHFYGSILGECDTGRNFIFAKMKEISLRAKLKYTDAFLTERETYYVLISMYDRFAENGLAEYFSRFAIITYLIYVSSSFANFDFESLRDWRTKGPHYSRINIISTDILDDIMNLQVELEEGGNEEIWRNISNIISLVWENYSHGFHQISCLSIIAFWDLMSKIVVYSFALERYGFQLFRKVVGVIQKFMYLELQCRWSQKRRILRLANEFRRMQD
nr:expressed protein [Hymenolepis microstoma]